MKKACTLLIAILLISLAENSYAQAPKVSTVSAVGHSVNPNNLHIPNIGFNQQAIGTTCGI